MRDWELETSDELCRRAHKAIAASRELTAEARDDVERALAFLQGGLYASWPSPRRYNSG
jgi:hypothetical protein